MERKKCARAVGRFAMYACMRCVCIRMCAYKNKDFYDILVCAREKATYCACVRVGRVDMREREGHCK